MFKKIIILLLLTTISTKINEVSSAIEFDVEQPILKDDHVFTFSNTAQDTKFYLVEMDIVDNMVRYEYKCPGSSGSSGGYFTFSPDPMIIKAQTGECSISIELNDWNTKDKRTIWIHPLDREIEIDLVNQTYQLKHYAEFNEKFPSLVFSVSNLTESITAKFEYERSLVKIDDNYYSLKNPFRVCLENDCKDDIKEYKFIEGKVYKIEMKIEEITSGSKKYYYLEGGSFYKSSGEDDTTDGRKTDEDRTDISGVNHILVNPIIYLILSILLLLN